MTAAPHSPLLELVARAMVLASTGTRDPDKLVPAPRGRIGMVPLWQSYAHLAQAALDACQAEELKAMLESLLACQILDETGRHKGWRVSAGSDHGGGLTQRAEAARALLAKLDGRS